VQANAAFVPCLAGPKMPKDGPDSGFLAIFLFFRNFSGCSYPQFHSKNQDYRRIVKKFQEPLKI
jgi:hypothetical protein